MNPIRIYDYLILTRHRIFDWVRPLSAEQYAQEFPIGPGSLGKTFTHMMISEWYYIERIENREVPPYEEWPIKDENPLPFPELEATWNKQAKSTKAALSEVRDWNRKVEYRMTMDDGRKEHVTATAGDMFTQLFLHEIHHRAQLMNMLRQLGIPAEDLDYNRLMFTRREVD